MRERGRDAKLATHLRYLLVGEGERGRKREAETVI
jgi:hypothetical protein